MQALISAAVTPEFVSGIEEHHGWTTSRVASVADAVTQLSPDERKHLVALVVEAEPVSSALIASLPALEVIACLRSDPVNVDLAAASEAGVPVVFSPGRNAESLADFTLALLLAMLRGVARAHHEVVSGGLTVDDDAVTHSGSDVIWSSPDLAINPYEFYKGPELSSLIVAVIGHGHMGAAVAGRLAKLVQQVLVVDPRVDPARVAGGGFELVPLSDALARADVVTLHARSSEVIIGAAELARLRPGSYLINTARATVLDYDAVADALRSGHLRAAALDVFPEEPLRSSSPLLTLPNVTLTPHLAGASLQVVQRQSSNLAAVLRHLYDGSRPAVELPIANAETLSRRGAWPVGRRLVASEGEAS